MTIKIQPSSDGMGKRSVKGLVKIGGGEAGEAGAEDEEGEEGEEGEGALSNGQPRRKRLPTYSGVAADKDIIVASAFAYVAGAWQLRAPPPHSLSWPRTPGIRFTHPPPPSLFTLRPIARSPQQAPGGRDWRAGGGAGQGHLEIWRARLDATKLFLASTTRHCRKAARASHQKLSGQGGLWLGRMRKTASSGTPAAAL